MKGAPTRHLVEYAAFRLFQTWLLRRPHEQVAVPGRRMGRLAHRLMGSKRELALRNVARVFPDMPESEREAVVKRCFEHIGSYFMELLSASRLGLEDLVSRFEVSGMEHLGEALGEGSRGCFLTTGHYGSWEMAMYPLAAWAAKHGRTFHAVARPFDNPRLQEELQASRQRFGIEIIQKKGAAHRMLNAYRNGGLVAIIIDQHIHPNHGIEVPFFGEPAWTSPVLATLSLRTETPVVPFTCLPGPEAGHYRLKVRAAIEPVTPGSKCPKAEAEMTRRYLEAVEEDVRKRPEYWLWMHRRWRS